MKNLNTFLIFAFLLAFPVQALATVDITLEDGSTRLSKSISVTVDTDTDTLGTVVLPIEYSEDVTITEVNASTEDCSNFDYSDAENIVTITCGFDEPMALSGLFADIQFTSSGEDYFFKVLDNDDLNLGDLVLGDVVEIGVATIQEEVAAESDETTTEEEAPSLISTQGEVEDTSGFSMDKLTEYLPYILIAGSVVLLISIVGILLTKKKSSGNTDDPVSKDPFETESTETVSTETTTTQEPTLKDIVNPASTQEVPAPVETPPAEPMQQTLDKPLYPSSTPVQTVSEVPSTPMPQQNLTAPVTNTDQDLQDILKSEEAINTQPTVELPSVPPVIPQQQPLENIMPEASTPTPEELQKKIDEEIGQMGNVTPPTQPTVTPETTTEDLPPVPPTM